MMVVITKMIYCLNAETPSSLLSLVCLLLTSIPHGIVQTISSILKLIRIVGLSWRDYCWHDSLASR